jgi:ParB-like nuclease domain
MALTPDHLAHVDQAEQLAAETTLAPSDIAPAHPVRNTAKLDWLVETLQRNGWHGRPLLVVPLGPLILDPPPATPYYAWTGAHRLAAALEAELATVPVVIVNAAALLRRGVRAAEITAAKTDREKLALLRRGGPCNQRAHFLMKAEHILNCHAWDLRTGTDRATSEIDGEVYPPLPAYCRKRR